MGRMDYDDMDSRNNRRGHKATRLTVLVSLFVILTIAIIIIVYVILHPGNEIKISEKVDEIKIERKEEVKETPVILVEEEVPALVDDKAEAVEEVIPLIEEIPLEEVTEEDVTPPPEEEPLSPTIEENPISIEEPVPQIEEEIVEIKEEETPVKEVDVEITVEEIPIEEVKVDVEEEETVVNPLSLINSSSIVHSSQSRFENNELYISGKSGSAVYALYDGFVVKSGKEEGSKYIIIKTSEGDAVKYSGFERVIVHNKDRIRKGDIIGSIGKLSSDTVVLEYIYDYEK